MNISSMLSGTVYVLAFTFTVMLSIPVFDASSTTISSKLFTIYVGLKWCQFKYCILSEYDPLFPIKG